MQQIETDIIVHVEGAEIDRTPRQTTADPEFMRIATRAKTGPLHLRVSVEAAPRLAEAIMTRTRDVMIGAQEVAPNVRGDDAMLTVVGPTHALTVGLSRAALGKLQNRIAGLLGA
jgi:hypothetical protein